MHWLKRLVLGFVCLIGGTYVVLYLVAYATRRLTTS
jgi:hypothetical protein